MRPFRILLLATLLISLAACGGGGAPQPTTTTLHVIEHATTDAVGYVNGAQDDAVGNTLGFANEVFDEANANKVGADNGLCVRTAVGAAWECVWTISLDKGQITVEGPFYDTQDSVLAITGGTGEYSEARGSMTLHARNAQGSEYDFVYTIIK
jgi:hypothetical protein